MDISGKRIVLTGAASGIGRALLEALAHFPCHILAADVSGDELQEAALRLTDAPAHLAAPLVCDLSTQDGVEQLLAAAEARLGGVDLFIANAGFAYYGYCDAPDWQALERIFRLNVLSPLYAAQAMRAQHQEQPYKVVIMASAMAFWALPGYAVYGATKAAVDRFAEGFRLELDDPRRLAIVYPISTRTRFFARAAAHSAPLPWPSQTPEQVARAVIRGIERDAQSIFPSRLFALLRQLERLLPGLRRLAQWRERRQLARWGTQAIHEETWPRAGSRDAGGGR